MALVGNPRPRRLHRLTSFSIVTEFARSVTASAAFSADKQHPPAVSIFVNAHYSSFAAGLFNLRSALLKRDYLDGNAAACLDFENRNRARDVDQIVRQRRAARIYHQRLAKTHDAFEMAMSHHEHIHPTAEMAFHRAVEYLVGGLVGSRQRMRKSNPQTFDFDQMCHANTFVNFELMLMSVEAFVAVAERRNHGRYCGKLVEHAVDVNVAGVHNEVDAVEDLEPTLRHVLHGLRYVRIRN